MAAKVETHPSAEELRGLVTGQLEEEAAARIVRHLEICPDCCRSAADANCDDFLERLRQAHRDGSTPAPDESTVGTDSRPASGPAADESVQFDATLPPEFQLPPEFGNHPQYEFLRELGRGGMGVVYLARNRVLDRLEVLKVVSKGLLHRPGAVERFLREIRMAAKLNHPNVVTAYSAVQAGESLAFAMEYIEGEDLAKLVQTQGPLSVAEACEYVRQAALGMQHAFEKKMVHRDLKPQNLILSREGERPVVKILDFGLAKAVSGEDDDAGLTEEGVLLGTPAYVAPEQTLDAASTDVRSDIYSLGCTLYFLLTGLPPFKGRSRFEVLQAHQTTDAKPLHQVRPDVPEQLADVVTTMMAKEPAKRYPTPIALVRALAPFARDAAGDDRSANDSDRLANEMAADTPGVSVTDLEGSGPRFGPASSERRPADSAEARTGAHRWLRGGSIVAAVLLLGLLGLWGAGVIRLRTPEGTLVIEVNVPNPDVLVDGGKATVTWDQGGKKATIRVPPGTRKVEVSKDGFTASGNEVTVSDGETRVLTARLEPQQRAEPPPRLEPVAGAEGSRAGEERDDNVLKMKLCWCPAGASPGFWMGKYELTQSEWGNLMAMPSHVLNKGKGDRHPVYYVSHADAMEFCRKLTEAERKAGRLPKGWEYRLPTDAQWEFACRAGTTTATAFGDTLDSTQANFNGDWPHNPEGGAAKGPNRGKAVEVGSFPPNKWGIHDMHGNVGEFVSVPGRHRGGSWTDSGRNCCSAIFVPDPPSANEHVGFRVARVRSAD